MLVFWGMTSPSIYYACPVWCIDITSCLKVILCLSVHNCHAERKFTVTENHVMPPVFKNNLSLYHQMFIVSVDVHSQNDDGCQRWQVKKMDGTNVANECKSTGIHLYFDVI